MKTIIAILLLCSLYSCTRTKDIGKEYFGAIVIGTCKNGMPEYFITLKKTDSTFVTLKVYPSYFDFYKSGDTIK